MKKLLGISVMAMLAVSPMMASAASTPVTLMTAPGQAEQTAGGTTVPTVEANQQIATTSYVTGAYNVLGAAHNALNNRVDTLEANSVTEGSVDYKIKTQAAGADYNNNNSGLEADTIQEAIDEVEGRVDTLETNTTLSSDDVTGHSTTLVQGASVKNNLIKLATAIEGLNNDSTVADGAYIKNNKTVTQNLTALDTAAEQNSNAIAAILDSNIPVYGTWNSTTPSNVTVGSLQSSMVSPAASTRPANQGD